MKSLMLQGSKELHWVSLIVTSLSMWVNPLKPTEKEKETCLCIHWLNPHLFLKSINKFWKSVDVKHEYQSLTTHLEELSNIDKDDNSLFSEKKDKEVRYYIYEQKNGVPERKRQKWRPENVRKVSELVSSLIKNAPGVHFF